MEFGPSTIRPYNFASNANREATDSRLSTWWNNQLTGDLDFQRQLDLMQIEHSFSAEEAKKNRDYQTEMSNTAYQRAVEDLRKAGLNPYLAYQQGGASSPAGSFATTGSRSSHSTGGQFMNSATQFVNTVMNNATKLITNEKSNNNATLNTVLKLLF